MLFSRENNGMQQVVSITSQGQINLPKVFRESIGIDRPMKAVLKKHGESFIITPKKDFWSLGGSLGGKIKLTDKELSDARSEFSRKWSNEK